MTTAADIHADYVARASALRARRVAENGRVDRLGNLRLAVFLAALLLAARSATATTWGTAWLVATGAATVLFALLVRASNRAKAALRRTDDLALLADEGANRVARDWNRIPEREWPPEAATHPYATDLDLFGPASLAQLMPPMSRAPGRTTVREWLVAPAGLADIRARQQAVAELRDDVEFRESLAVAGMRVTVAPAALDELARWATGAPWVSTTPLLVATSMLLPLLTLGLIAAQAAGWVHGVWWAAPAVAAWFVTGRYAAALRDRFAPLAGRAVTFRRYAEMTRLAVGRESHATMLAGIRDDLTSPTGAARAMDRLTALADSADLRLSPMLYFAVNTLTMWDFHVAHLLERWQRHAGAHARQWLDALGRLEALSALATLSYDNPDWTFPEVAPDAGTIDAGGLGHPLLAASAGVRNDVVVGPAGTMLVVTGSNMAGKSTLLRSIGVNLVLAQAGSTVCARRLRHPPVALYTSMRVQDSLQRGVSYFMAELERLKVVVDAADTMQPASGRVFVYLLDEMLHGTNSAERTIAARRVLAHLAHTAAIGVVSTHDLQLVDAPELAPLARHVHFSETLGGAAGAGVMTFDYRLRPGKATSSNALRLLELVGLDLPPTG